MRRLFVSLAALLLVLAQTLCAQDEAAQWAKAKTDLQSTDAGVRTRVLAAIRVHPMPNDVALALFAAADAAKEDVRATLLAALTNEAYRRATPEAAKARENTPAPWIETAKDKSKSPAIRHAALTQVAFFLPAENGGDLKAIGALADDPAVVDAVRATLESVARSAETAKVSVDEEALAAARLEAEFEKVGDRDDLPVEEALLESLKHLTTAPSPKLRDAAARALVRFAANSYRRGDVNPKMSPAEKVRLALRIATDARILDDAIDLAGVLGDTSSLESFTRPEVAARRDAVARAKLKFAKKIGETDKAKAVLMLFEAARNTGSKKTRERAITLLKGFGEDTSVIAARSGFIVKWRVLGGFKKSTKDDIGKDYFGDDRPDATETHEIDGKTQTFKDAVADGFDGVIDLRKVVKPADETSCYAVAYVEWPREEDMMLKIGSDDGVAAWVNAQLVHTNLVDRGVVVDDDLVPVRFKAGSNEIVIKVSQGNGDFGFVVRVATKDGTPVDLTKK